MAVDRVIELSPADELEMVVDRTDARLGVLLYYDVDHLGKANFNVLFAQDPKMGLQETVLAFQGLAKGILTHYERLKAAARREQRGGIIIPGEEA